jgi:methoxymalonate biosynthesis acyl carrier protein
MDARLVAGFIHTKFPSRVAPQKRKMDGKEKIKQFLSRFFRNHQIGNDDDIFGLGFVNSLMALQLVNFLQKEFEITIEDEDLDIKNFRTINSMHLLVERKCTSRGRR